MDCIPISLILVSAPNETNENAGRDSQTEPERNPFPLQEAPPCNPSPMVPRAPGCVRKPTPSMLGLCHSRPVGSSQMASALAQTTVQST